MAGETPQPSGIVIGTERNGSGHGESSELTATLNHELPTPKTTRESAFMGRGIRLLCTRLGRSAVALAIKRHVFRRPLILWFSVGAGSGREWGVRRLSWRAALLGVSGDGAALRRYVDEAQLSGRDCPTRTAEIGWWPGFGCRSGGVLVLA